MALRSTLRVSKHSVSVGTLIIGSASGLPTSLCRCTWGILWRGFDKLCIGVRTSSVDLSTLGNSCPGLNTFLTSRHLTLCSFIEFDELWLHYWLQHLVSNHLTLAAYESPYLSAHFWLFGAPITFQNLFVRVCEVKDALTNWVPNCLKPKSCKFSRAHGHSTKAQTLKPLSAPKSLKP